MKKSIFAALALTIFTATLVGCGANTPNSQTTELTAPTNKAVIKIDQQLFPAPAKGSAKTVASATAEELQLRTKIDHVNFMFVDQNGVSSQAQTLPVIQGRLTGTLTADPGTYTLQADYNTKNGTRLFYASIEVDLGSNVATAITLVAKMEFSVSMPTVITKPTGKYTQGNVYQVDMQGANNSFGGGDNYAFIDANGDLHFRANYLVAPLINMAKVIIIDDNQDRHAADFSFDLIKAIDESNANGFVTLLWPAPASLSVGTVFENDGGIVKAVFASAVATPSRNQLNTTLSYVNLANTTSKTVTIKKMTVTVWDGSYINNIHLAYQGSLTLPTCTILAQDSSGQTKLSCEVNLQIAAASIATFHLRGDIGNYPMNEMLAVEFTNATIVDDLNNSVAFSGSGSSGGMVN